MRALSGLFTTTSGSTASAMGDPAVEIDLDEVSEDRKILLNYGDIPPADYLPTVLHLGINHTHPQIDSTDGDSYTDLLYKRLHCASEVLKWEAAARLSVLFVLGYDEIKLFVENAAHQQHVNSLSKHLLANDAVLTNLEHVDAPPNFTPAQQNVLSTLLDLLPPRNRHSTKRDQHGFSECDRFAQVCKDLFGEDLIPNEDALYDKARLKAAEQKLQKLVQDGYKAREPMEVRRDMHWLLGQMVDGLYLRAALNQHCSEVYDLDDEVFCVGEMRCDRAQLTQQPASTLLRLARKMIGHVMDMCNNVGEFPRVGLRLAELRDAMQPPEWIAGHEGGLALQKRQELIAYLQHAADWFHKVHNSGNEHELAQMLPSSSRQGRGTLIRCKDYADANNNKVIMIASRRYQINKEAALVDIGVACHQKYRAVFENGDLWLKVDEQHGRPLQTVMGQFERIALMTGDLVIEVELHTPAAARSLNSREHIFLPCSTFEPTVVPSDAHDALHFVPYAMYVARPTALSMAQRQVLRKLASSAQTAGITASELVDFMTFIELFHNPPVDAQAGRESALEVMLRTEPIQASRLLYGSFRPQYAEVCVDFIRQYRDVWMSKLSNKDGSQDTGQRLALALICATDVDAHMAIASAQAFHMALDQILQVTKHRVVQVSVHSSNYESVLRQALEINRATSLTFMCLHIADNVSTADIVGLLSICEAGSLRMIVQETPHVVSSVQNRIAPNKVILIRSEQRQALIQKGTYRQSTTVGELVRAVSHLPLPAVKRVVQEAVGDVQLSKDLVDLDEEQSHQLMVLVISDPDALKNFFQDRRVSVIDAIYKRDLERFMNNVSVSSSGAKRTSTRLVLLRAELLSSEYLSVLSMRAENLSIKLTLVTTCLPISHIQRLKLEPNQVHRIDVNEEMAHSQFQKAGVVVARDGSPKKAGDEHHGWSEDDLFIVYRMCRLVLGKQFLLSAVTPALMGQLQAKEMEAVTEQLKRFSGVSVDAAAVRAFARELCVVVSTGLDADVSEFLVSKAAGGGDILVSWGDRSVAECVAALTRVACAAVQHTKMEADLALEDFVRQHAIMSFLPQKTRLELWLAHLVHQAGNPSCVIELPQGQNYHCLHPLAYFGGDICIDPGFICLPRGQMFTTDDYVHRSVQDEEFDWNFCHHEPQLNQISTDNLLTMLQAYRYPLKLLFSLRARSLFEYFDRRMGEQWRVALNRVAIALAQLLNFLSEFDLDQTAHSHLSVLKWTIGLHASATQSSLLPVTEHNIDELVRMKLPICVASDRSRLEQSLPLFIQLEGPPNFLYNQAELRKALVETSQSKLEQLLARASGKGNLLGAAFVSFILNQRVQEIAANAPNVQSGMFSHPLVRTLTSVLNPESAMRGDQGDYDQSLNFIGSTVRCKEIFRERLPELVRASSVISGLQHMTPRAWATSVLATIQERQVDWLFAALVASEPWTAQLSNSDLLSTEKRFFTHVLNQLNEEQESNRHEHWLSFRFLHHVIRHMQRRWEADETTAAGAAEEKTNPLDENPPTRRVPLARTESSTVNTISLARAETLFAKVADDLQGSHELSTIEFCKRRQRRCPIESLPFLCDMYLDAFKNTSDVHLDEQVDMHLGLLSPQAWNMILRRFYSSGSEDPLQYGWLLLIAWSMYPYGSLPVRDRGDAECIKKIVENQRINFKDTVDENLSRVAPLGLFLAAPDYLNTTTYNYYAKLFGLREIESQLFLIGQKDHQIYPPYFVSVFARKLNLSRLLREFNERRLDRVKATAVEYKRDPSLDGAYDYNLLSGISLETLHSNLLSLVAILYLSQTQSKYGHDGTRQMAACVVHLWFVAAGIPKATLEGWLHTIDPQLVNIFSSMHINHTEFVYQPFPALCSPQLVASGGEKLFGSSERDFQFTMQTWQAIDPANSPVSKIQDSLGRREPVRDATGSKVIFERWQPTARYLTAFPEECSRVFGRTIAQRVLRVDGMTVPPTTNRKTNIKLNYTRIQSALTPFARLLLLCVDPERCEVKASALLPRIIEAFVAGFRAGCNGKPDDNRQKYAAPILFRALMSAVGISSLLRTESIHATLVTTFRKHRMELCQASLNELQFFEEQGLHRMGLTPAVTFSRQGVFVQIETAKLLTKSEINEVETNHTKPFNSIGLTSNYSAPTPRGTAQLLEAKAEEFDDDAKQADSGPLFAVKELHVKTLPTGNNSAEAATSSGQKRDRSISKPCIICCDDLLVVEKFNGFATVRLTPGKTVTLLKVHSQSPVQSHELYTFVTNATSQRFTEQMHGLKNNLAPVCALNDHQAALNFILELPVGSMLYTSGILLMLMPDRSFRPYFNLAKAMPVEKRNMLDCLDAVEVLKLRIDPMVKSIVIACARAITASYDKKYSVRTPDLDGTLCRRRYRVAQQHAFETGRPVVMLQVEARCSSVEQFVGLVVKTMRGTTSGQVFSFDRAFATMIENIVNGTIGDNKIVEGYNILKPVLLEDPAGGASLMEMLKALRSFNTYDQLLALLRGGEGIPEIELVMSPLAAAAGADVAESLLYNHRAFFVDLQAARESTTPAKRRSKMRRSSLFEEKQDNNDDFGETDGVFELFDLPDDGDASYDDGDYGDEHDEDSEDMFDFDLVPVDLEEQESPDLDVYASRIIKCLADQDSAALSKWETEKWHAFVNDTRCRDTGRGARLHHTDAAFPGSIQGPNCAQLQFANPPMDERRYNPEHGTPLLFLFPPAGPKIQQLVEELDVDGHATLATQLLAWLCHVTRAPLRTALKEIICSLVVNDVREFLEHSMDEKVCMLGLTHVCPIPTMQQMLRDSLRTSNESPLERLCARSDGRYGIRFTHRGTFYELQELGVTVEKLDLTVEYANKTDSLSNMYLRIVDELVAGSCSFVYVRGLSKVDDTLLKWCSEFTPRNPWCWIFFENASTVFNLVENIDRAIIDEAKYATEEDQLRALDKKPRVFEEGPVPMDSVIENKPTQKVASWERQFEDCLATLPWVMLAGDPGIGKTYYLNEEVMNRDSTKQYFAVVQRVDGSSDRFVREAITDVLDALVAAADGKKILLCLDEFHMMTPTQKRQLLLWTKGHTANVKLVMISNRLDQADFSMFKEILQERPGQIIEARGTMNKLMEKQVMRLIEGDLKLEAQRGAVLAFVFLWVRSSRSLFGDLMMTMRPIPELVSYIGDDRRLSEYLSRFLQKKIPTLSRVFCEEYIQQLFEIFHDVFREPEVLQYLDLDGVLAVLERYTNRLLRRGLSDKDPLRVFVRASLLDCRLDSDAQPYPEYSANLPAHHPFRRLACWVGYMVNRECTRRGVAASKSLEELVTEVETQLHTSMDIVDLPMRFPRLHRTAMPTNAKNTCDVLCSTVHPSDLLGLIDALQRGYTIDVDEAKRYWSVNPVTDVTNFDRLLSNYATLLPLLFDSGPYTESMASMVQTLVRHSDELGLAQKCVQQLQKTAQSGDNSPSRATLLVAFWKIYRFSELSTTSGLGIDLTCLRDAHGDLEMLQLLSNLFKWAAEFGYNSLEVLDRAAERSELLRMHLLMCTHLLGKQLLRLSLEQAVEHDAFACIKSYATNLFSGLLVDPSSEQEFVDKIAENLGLLAVPRLYQAVRISENGVPNAIWMLLAKTQPVPSSEWPLRLQLLTRLFHGTASASDIDHLVVTDGVWRDVFESSHPLVENMRVEFVERVLQSTSQLYVDTQRAILDTPQLMINDPDLADDVVIAKFHDALRGMNADDIKISNCVLRTKLIQEHARLQG